jgi:hypothetical protein
LFLQGLANAVLLATENKPVRKEKTAITTVGRPGDISAVLINDPVDLRSPTQYGPYCNACWANGKRLVRVSAGLCPVCGRAVDGNGAGVV